MGEEKKITITGVDSIQIDYDFATGAYTAPGAFRIDPESSLKDFVKSRKITEVVVHDKDGLLLAVESVASTMAWVEIVTDDTSIVVADYSEGNDARIYINYPRAGYRGRCAGLYHPDLEMVDVKINDASVTGWDGKGTVEIYYRQKLPTSSSQGPPQSA